MATKTVLLRIRRARFIREARRLSLEDVSEATGLKKSRLSRYERCERMMTHAALDQLSKMYRQPIDSLNEELLIDGSGRLVTNGAHGA